ncbi:MAG TPA: alpha/beta family hydrolase [Acidimicrobiales bacterium]|nr:alpha/beta family hydrolase [Acidimicrobiales bacterium]
MPGSRGRPLPSCSQIYCCNKLLATRNFSGRSNPLPSGAVAGAPYTSRPGETRARGRKRIAGVLLAPGAGGSADSPAIVVLAEALTATGVVVERMDFPYRLAGRRRPDPAGTLEAAVRERATALADRLGVGTGELVLGGRSMGGRICSQVTAAGLPSAGLLLVSYPLHPPGRPDRLRTAHFPDLRVPCLFVSGTRDAFGTREELETAAASIPGRVHHVWIEGGDHALRRRDGAAAEAAARWLAASFVLPSP